MIWDKFTKYKNYNYIYMHNFKMAQFFIVIFNLNIKAIYMYICTLKFSKFILFK